MDTLGALDIFLAVVDRLSFAEAGRHLGLSPSAIGKSIARLEQRLGVHLFHRTTRRVSLTVEGELLRERASRIREEVDDLAAVLAQAAAEPQGRLRISLPAIGYRFLGPHLTAFARTYPKVQLDLDFSDGLVDLVADGVDAAIRSGVLADSRLIAPTRRISLRRLRIANLHRRTRRARNRDRTGRACADPIPATR